MKDKASQEIAYKLLDKLTELRKKQGLSHEKLAAMTGLSRPAISYIESKKRMPTILTCLKLCRALDVKLEDILKNLKS